MLSYAFFGVAFAFLAGAFFVAAGFLTLVTRPDLVFFNSVGVSTTAGAVAGAAALAALGFDALLVAVLALGLAAVVFALVAVLGLATLVAAFLGAAFFATLGLVSDFSF